MNNLQLNNREQGSGIRDQYLCSKSKHIGNNRSLRTRTRYPLPPYSLILLLFSLFLLFATSCENVFSIVETDTPVSGVRISVGSEFDEAKTLYPTVRFSKFILSFTGPSYVPNIEFSAAVTSTLVELPSGIWTIDVTGFVNIDGTEYPAASGSEQILVNSETFQDVRIFISAINAAGGKGQFKYTVLWPDDADLISAKLYFYPFGTPRPEGIDLTNGTSGVMANVDRGYYMMVAQLFDGNGYAARTEIVHIYSNMETIANIVFTGDDFAAEWNDPNQPTIVEDLEDDYNYSNPDSPNTQRGWNLTDDQRIGIMNGTLAHIELELNIDQIGDGLGALYIIFNRSDDFWQQTSIWGDWISKPDIINPINIELSALTGFNDFIINLDTVEEARILLGYYYHDLNDLPLVSARLLGYGKPQEPDPDEIIEANVNGYTSFMGLINSATYDIVNIPSEGMYNVMRVYSETVPDQAAYYPLDDYKDKRITIEFSADVKRKGDEGALMWQINNAHENYPTVTSVDAVPDTWYSMSGTWTGIPVNDYPMFYLDSWNDNNPIEKSVIYYIANFTITVTEVEEDAIIFEGFENETFDISVDPEQYLKIGDTLIVMVISDGHSIVGWELDGSPIAEAVLSEYVLVIDDSFDEGVHDLTVIVLQGERLYSKSVTFWVAGN